MSCESVCCVPGRAPTDRAYPEEEVAEQDVGTILMPTLPTGTTPQESAGAVSESPNNQTEDVEKLLQLAKNLADTVSRQAEMIKSLEEEMSKLKATSSSSPSPGLSVEDQEDLKEVLSGYREYRDSPPEDEDKENAGYEFDDNMAASKTAASLWLRAAGFVRYPRLGHRRKPAGDPRIIGALSDASSDADRNAPATDAEKGGDPKHEEDAGQRPSWQSLEGDLKHDRIKNQTRDLVEVYVWVESVWDMAYLIGTHGKTGQAIYSTFLVLLNIVTQVTLCVIIADSFTSPTVDDDLLNALSMWRVDTGHDVEWMNKMTDESLVFRICNGHQIVPVSSSVAQIFDLTLDYVGSEHLGVQYRNMPALGTWWVTQTYWKGVVLCSFSIFIWWMTVAQDVMHMADLVFALKILPIAENGETVIKVNKNDRKLVSISHLRRAALSIVLAVRAGVCFVMLLTGTIFLSYTIELSELLLNCTALTIVLELDNLIFIAFAPGQARALLKTMRPLRRPHEHKAFGVSLRYWIALAIMFAGAIIIMAVVLVPQAADIKRVQDEICGGNLDFISVVAANGAVVAAPVNRSQTKSTYETAASTYQFAAVRQLIGDIHARGQRDASADYINKGMSTPTARPKKGDFSGISVGVSGPSYSLKAISAMPVSEIQGYWNTHCTDAEPLDNCTNTSEPHADPLDRGCWKMYVLHNVTPDMKIRRCADVIGWCGADSLAGVRARQHCPKTCRCDDPFAPNMFPEPDMGCPSSCTDYRVKQSYRESLKNRPCEDSRGKDAKMEDYRRGLQLVSQYYPKGHQEFANSTIAAVNKSGCKAAESPIDSLGYRVDLCSAHKNFLNFKPLISLCPVTCNCKGRKKFEPEMFEQYCPSECAV